jgi:hypothetical protein
MKKCLQLSHRKQELNLKTSKGLELTFLQRYTYQQAPEKMSDIINHQGNANHKHDETPLHAHWDAC